MKSKEEILKEYNLTKPSPDLALGNASYASYEDWNNGWNAALEWVLDFLIDEE